MSKPNIDNFTFTILKSDYFKWPLLILFLIFALIIAYFSSIKDIKIFPNSSSFNFETYTDKSNGGNSEIILHSVSDSVIKTEFLLHNAFHSPYVGVSAIPFKEKFVNAGSHNQITLELKGENMDRVGISIFTPPVITSKTGSKVESLYHEFLNISNKRSIYKLSLNQFKHPEWWEDLHHSQKINDDKPDFNKILHINIGCAYDSFGVNKKKTFSIYSLTISRNNQKLFSWLTFCFISIVLINYIVLYIMTYRKIKKLEVVISYKPLEVVDNTLEGEEKCIEYINTNYQDNDLTLDKISEITNISQRKITKIIKDKFDSNFKTYLNSIRINESKRLLSQTELNIGEIAYKIGFNNQSHFNRVFKSEMNISPSKYRINCKQ